MYENGKCKPDMEILRKIAVHYGITTDQLMDIDCDELGSFRNLFASENRMEGMFCTLMPVVESEEAMQNKYFRLGMRLIRRVRDCNSTDDKLTLLYVAGSGAAESSD